MRAEKMIIVVWRWRRKEGKGEVVEILVVTDRAQGPASCSYIVLVGL
jgi:hypothetical protein